MDELVVDVQACGTEKRPGSLLRLTCTSCGRWSETGDGFGARDHNDVVVQLRRGFRHEDDCENESGGK